MKYLFVIYVELDCLLKKTIACDNNSEKSSTAKEYDHEASGYSIFTLMRQNISQNIIDAKTVQKDFVRTYKNMQQNNQK